MMSDEDLTYYDALCVTLRAMGDNPERFPPATVSAIAHEARRALTGLLPAREWDVEHDQNQLSLDVA